MGESSFDFGEFHPLDHRFWQCWQRNDFEPIYGRTLVHLKYLLLYKYELPTPRGLWHRLTCLFGRHEMMKEDVIRLGRRMITIPAQCLWCGCPPKPLPQNDTRGAEKPENGHQDWPEGQPSARRKRP